MNYFCPEELVNRDGIHGDGDDEERGFRCCYLATAVLNDQQEHPGQQDHAVSVRELPATGVSMTPEKERQHSDHDPAESPAFSTFAKQEKKKRAGDKDRTTEGNRAQVREYRHIYHPSKQHFVGVPANVVEGTQPISVPRLVWKPGILANPK